MKSVNKHTYVQAYTHRETEQMNILAPHVTSAYTTVVPSSTSLHRWRIALGHRDRLPPVGKGCLEGDENAIFNALCYVNDQLPHPQKLNARGALQKECLPLQGATGGAATPNQAPAKTKPRQNPDKGFWTRNH